MARGSKARTEERVVRVGGATFGGGVVVLVDEAEVRGEHFVVFGGKIFLAEVLAFLVLFGRG